MTNKDLYNIDIIWTFKNSQIWHLVFLCTIYQIPKSKSWSKAKTPLRKTGNKPSVVWFRSDLEDILTGSAQRGLSSLLPFALYLTGGNTFRSVCTILYFKALPPTTWLSSTKEKLLGQVHLRAAVSVKVMQLKVCCGLSNMREGRLVCLKGIFRSWEKIKPQCRC